MKTTIIKILLVLFCFLLLPIEVENREIEPPVIENEKMYELRQLRMEVELLKSEIKMYNSEIELLLATKKLNYLKK